MLQSPYRRGAHDGFTFGIYLTAMFFCSIFAINVPLLGLISFVLMVGVPLVIYRYLVSFERSLGEAASFPMLWMQGVVIFFCGSLIVSAAMVVYMKWIEPDYILNQIKMVADMSGTAPGTFMDEAAEVAQAMIDNKFIPSPISIMTEIIMLAIVTGSILSIAISALLALKRNTRRTRNQMIKH